MRSLLKVMKCYERTTFSRVGAFVVEDDVFSVHRLDLRNPLKIYFMTSYHS